MNECKLPIKIELPDNFLDEEIRCEYTISSHMKEVWAVQLDLLKEFSRVCDKHSIRYFASGGTMLGAVRHKGYIPWDDDIDLMMYRNDYEKLCEVAKSEFNTPYFFQTEYSEPGSLGGHAQLRNTETTAILNCERGRYKFNQGIFLDIFPLDNVINDTDLFNKQFKRAMLLRKFAHFFAAVTSTRFRRVNTIRGNILFVIYKLFGKLFEKLKFEQKFYKKFELECQRYNDRETEMISSLSFMFDCRQHFKFRSDYSDFIDMPFEFMTIPVGKEYDHALTLRYGEYMKYERGTSCHGDVFFDTEKSYKNYI